MDIDGSNVQRITDGGYAVSPSWAPNGQLLAFSWNRKYGPGDPGGDDIHVIDLASKEYLQITHESGATTFRRGRPTTATLCFSAQSAVAPRSGRCWRMGPDNTNSRKLEIIRCRTGVGSDFKPGT